jgi:outer membrane lipoprotein-sorting protein
MKSGLIMLTSVFLSIPVHAATSAQDILVAVDNARHPAKPFSMTVDLIEYKQGKQTDSNTLEIYSKAAAATGRFNTLVRFLLPARDTNKLMLKSGNDLWFYDPNSKASIRISPQERLLGQASNGDVVTANFATDYKATIAGEEETQDGDRKQRNCVKLLLKASARDVTYDHMEIWVDKVNNQTVKGRFYSASDRLLKTVYYRRYTNVIGATMPGEAIIIDGLDPNWVTVMRYSNFSYKDIPDTWYQRDYLPNFRQN